MSLYGKILILFSLFAVLIASAAAQVSFLPAPSRPQHAGCHQPAPKTPVSYSCCQAGHDSLLLNSEFVHAPAQVATKIQQVVPISVGPRFMSVSRYSASPPGDLSEPVPLRV